MKFSARYLFEKRKKKKCRELYQSLKGIYSMRCFTYSSYHNVTNAIWFNFELLRCEFSIMPYIFLFLWLRLYLLASGLTVTVWWGYTRFSQMICALVYVKAQIFSRLGPFCDFILFYIIKKAFSYLRVILNYNLPYLRHGHISVWLVLSKLFGVLDMFLYICIYLYNGCYACLGWKVDAALGWASIFVLFALVCGNGLYIVGGILCEVLTTARRRYVYKVHTVSHRKTNKYCAIKFYNFIYSYKTLAMERLKVNQKLEYVYDDYKV